MITIGVDPEEGKPIRMQAIVPKLSESPGRMRYANEALGARNDEVYGELLGLGAKELEELREGGVI